MLLFSSLLVTLGAPSSDVSFVFRTLTVTPPLREVRFSGGKRGRYLVRGDRAGEVTVAVAVELVGLPKSPAQAAELVDTLEGAKPLTVAAATKVLSVLGVKPPRPLEVGEGETAGRICVERLFARTTPRGGGELLRSRFEFGPPFARKDEVLFAVDPAAAVVPSAPPPARSDAVEAFWNAVSGAETSPPRSSP